MPDNQDFFDWVTQKVVREIDVGELSHARAGQKLSVWVNAPGIVKAIYGGRERSVAQTTDSDGKVITETTYPPISADEEYARMRQAVSLLFEMPPEQVARIDDSTLLWLYNCGFDAYIEYRTELRENLSNG